MDEFGATVTPRIAQTINYISPQRIWAIASSFDLIEYFDLIKTFVYIDNSRYNPR